MKSDLRRCGVVACLGIVFVLLQGCGDGEKIPLTIRLSPGDLRTVIITENGQNTVVVNGTSIQSTGEQERAYTFSVQKVLEDGSIQMNGRIKKTRLTESSMAGGVPFQAFDNDKGYSIHQEIGLALKDQTFSITLSPQGEILNLEGTDLMLDHVRNTVNFGAFHAMQGLDREKIVEFREMFLEHYNENGFRAILASVFSVLPQMAVGRGDTWTVEPIRDASSDLLSERHFSWKELRGSQLTLSKKTSFLSLKGEDGKSMSGTETGLCVLDTEDGLIHRAEYQGERHGTRTGVSVSESSSHWTSVVEIFDF
jgi:hypothetical protein